MMFSEKLRQLRDAAGMSEVTLAARAGLPFGTVHGYAIGRREPSLAGAVALARALGVGVDVFAACYPAAAAKKERGK